jgi:predicted nucleic acid-binding protein
VEKITRRHLTLVDTGAIYALADERDRWHKPMVSQLETNTDRLIVPITIIPEACYLLNHFLGYTAEEVFVASLHKREMILEAISHDDLKRVLEVLKKYQSANIGFVDASIVAVSERLGIEKILTTDRKHFGLIRPNHVRSFTLLP